MMRIVRRLPFFKLLAIVELALVARRHLSALTPDERHRLADLARRGRSLSPQERRELRELADKLEPRAFASAAVEALSPVPLPRRFTGGRRRTRP